jgi:hypothetical protein
MKSYLSSIILLIFVSNAYCMEKDKNYNKNLFLDQLVNKTGKNLGFFIGGQIIPIDKLPQKMEHNYFIPTTGAIRIVGCQTLLEIRDYDDPNLVPYIEFEQYMRDQHTNLLYARLYYKSKIGDLISQSSIKAIAENKEITLDDQYISVSIVLEGDALEKSTIKICKALQPESLRKQALNYIATAITKKKLSLGNAKQVLPLELYQQLETLLEPKNETNGVCKIS